jgi:hypothetical protein
MHIEPNVGIENHKFTLSYRPSENPSMAIESELITEKQLAALKLSAIEKTDTWIEAIPSTEHPRLALGR